MEKRLREEIRRGVQTIQYQVVTLMTTNGQAPFVTVFMYLGEVDDPQTKRDLALIIEETLVQRYEGVKNEEGVWITPAFPISGENGESPADFFLWHQRQPADRSGSRK